MWKTANILFRQLLSVLHITHILCWHVDARVDDIGGSKLTFKDQPQASLLDSSRCARLFPMINGNLRFGAWSLFGKQFFFSFFISSSFRFHVEIRLHFLISFYAASLSCWFFVAQLIEFKLQPWWSWWLLCLGAFIVTLISVICRVSSLRLWYRE